IIDVRMPVMNGYELALKLNENREEDKVPIIFLTASHVDEIQVFEGYSSGAVDYIFKPVDHRILLCKVNVFLDLYIQKKVILQNIAELKTNAGELTRVNSALKESEGKYRSYIDHAPEGVFVADETGKYLEVNEAACRMTGYSREELLNMSVAAILPEESVAEGTNHFKNVIKKGSAKTEMLYLHKSGTKRWWAVEGVKLSDTRYLGFTEDITRRKVMEESLRVYQTELEMQNDELEKALEKLNTVSEKYIELYDFAPSGYFTLSAKMIIEDLNHRGAGMLGNDRSHLISQDFSKFVSPGTKDVFINFFQKILSNQAKEICEIQLRSGDNQMEYVHIEGVAAGNGNQCLINMVDITEKKRLEENLKSSEANFRTLFETLNDLVFVGDMQGTIIYVNNAVARKLVYPREDLDGMHISELHPEPMRSEAKKILGEVFAGKRDFCPLPLARRDHSMVPVETRVWIGKWNGTDCIFGLSKDLSAVQEALQKFNKIFDHNPSLMAISTVPDSIFTDVNATFLAKTGYHREEIIGKTSDDLGLFIQPEKQKEAAYELARTGLLRNFELQIKTRSGTIMDGLFSGEIIESQGKTYFLTVMTDITDRKQAEEEIRHTNSLLDSIVKNIPNMIFLKDAENLRFVQFNRAGEEMLGIPAEEMLGRSDYDFFTNKQADRFTEIDRKVLNNKLLYDIPEEPIQTRDKGIRILHTKKVPVLNASGEPDYLLGISEDITDRKLAEQAMIVGEEKYKTMLNASPDGIILINLKGIITEVSEIAIEILGSDTRDDLIGKHIFRFIPSTEKHILKDLIGKTINEGLAQNIGLNIRKKNQPVFASETSATLIQGPDGLPISFMIIIRDISYRKKMETKQIHADRMANLGEMATGIAHEINQPLNIISMVMDKILFESAKTDKIDLEFLQAKSDRIFENITRIRNIIDHIRAFSRSNDDFVLTAFDINASIENGASMIMEQFKHLGISLQFQLAKNIPQILGNTFKFEQVIVNLLVNAKDAVIERKNKQQEDFEMFVGIRSYVENQLIIVEVNDNGAGIGHDDINNVMLPFYTTKEEGKGTGLGLTICYQIIREMGGTVEIISDKVNGTKIKLILDLQTNK
ncbi:MAG: PAS domain S-box protein, partial [Bacteroidota bacterium]